MNNMEYTSCPFEDGEDAEEAKLKEQKKSEKGQGNKEE